MQLSPCDAGVSFFMIIVRGLKVRESISSSGGSDKMQQVPHEGLMVKEVFEVENFPNFEVKVQPKGQE